MRGDSAHARKEGGFMERAGAIVHHRKSVHVNPQNLGLGDVSPSRLLGASSIPAIGYRRAEEEAEGGEAKRNEEVQRKTPETGRRSHTVMLLRRRDAPNKRTMRNRSGNKVPKPSQ